MRADGHRIERDSGRRGVAAECGFGEHHPDEIVLRRVRLAGERVTMVTFQRIVAADAGIAAKLKGKRRHRDRIGDHRVFDRGGVSPEGASAVKILDDRAQKPAIDRQQDLDLAKPILDAGNG